MRAELKGSMDNIGVPAVTTIEGIDDTEGEEPKKGGEE